MIVGYFADGPWSHRALENLLKKSDVKIAFICARYDHPDETLKSQCENEDIPFIVHANVNSAEFIEIVDGYNCDLFVSLSFNQIFKKEIIEKPRLGIINCHAGKLPFYRGRNILNWALINDEREFGVTVHYVDQGIDTGDIIRQRSYPISDNDDYGTLLQRAYTGCAEILDQVIEDFLRGDVMRQPQIDIHPYGSYCIGRKVGDEILNWNQTSRQVFNFVRAISKPGPMARTFVGGEEIKINRVEYILDAPSYIGIPGSILAKSSSGFIVKTVDSYVLVTDWVAAISLKVGDRFR